MSSISPTSPVTGELSGANINSDEFNYSAGSLIEEIKSELKIRKEKGESFLTNLKKCVPGSGWREYENICVAIIKDVFSNDFRQPLTIKKNPRPMYSGVKKNIRDIVIANLPIDDSGNCYWNRIKNDLNANYIVFECKNYTKKISEDHVSQLHRYLSKNIGKIGILLTRFGGDESAERAVSRYNEDGYKIYIWSNKDVKKLINHFVVSSKIENFFVECQMKFDCS